MEHRSNAVRNSKPRAAAATHALCRHLSARIWSGILSKHYPLGVHSVKNISANKGSQEGLLTFTFTSECSGTWMGPHVLGFAWLLVLMVALFLMPEKWG